ncbi:MAG: AAA family ATPase [Deltaproteobacteria bacterium]|nr:AAA family ATPase [Deltaproteobacteria bacterium]
MPKTLPLGFSDFRAARLDSPSGNYVDKSLFCARVLRTDAAAFVFCRPRRFGKTLNITMLREFLQLPVAGDTPSRDPFAGMAILDDAEAMRHRGQHPVLYLSLKGVKAMHWPAALAAIRTAVLQAWTPVRVEPEQMSAMRRDELANAVARNAPARDLVFSLMHMVHALHEFHGKRVWLLIDEYDAPLQSAWLHGYYEECVTFFKTFFGEAAKDSSAVARTVMTGVLRVAKEGVLSDLNNLTVDTVLEHNFATDFGFTEAEVTELAGDDPALLAEMRRWYNGYSIGGHAIYNPWSVAETLSKPRDPLQARWIATGGTELLERLLSRAAPDVHTALELVLSGGSVEGPVVPGVAMRDIERDSKMLLTMLLHAGYLSASGVRSADGELLATLATPNLEVGGALRGLYHRWLANRSTLSLAPERLFAALLSGDQDEAQQRLAALVLGVLSYHDLYDRTPERIYHVFVLGVLSVVPAGYRIESNREFGHGRPDVVLLPGDAALPAALLEFKAAEDGETAATACDRAEAQIAKRRYVEAVRGSPVYAWAIGFERKRCVVRLVGAG